MSVKSKERRSVGKFLETTENTETTEKPSIDVKKKKAFDNGFLEKTRKPIEQLTTRKERAEALVKKQFGDNMGIVREARLIGGALITIALIAIVLNEILTTTAINNSTGPFTTVVDSLNNTGVAAMTLLIVGLLVVAANAILGRFGGGF